MTHGLNVTLQGTPVLTTERLMLRAPEPGDWPDWRAMLASERSRYIGGPLPEEGKAWRSFGHLIGHWVMRGFGMFVLCDKVSGRALGMAGPWRPAGWPEPEIGWNLWTDEAEGKGYALEGAVAARDFAFSTLGWRSCVSYIDPANARSIALAKRLGAILDEGAPTPENKPVMVWRHHGAAA